MTAAAAPVPQLVVDTNVVLDLLVFSDPSTRMLSDALAAGQLDWLATVSMRLELQRVLHYPAVRAALVARGLQGADVLARFDRSCAMRPIAPGCGVLCRDPDDQPFIDLAVAHRATLLSKDKQVLRLHRRLATLGVVVQPVFRPSFAA